MAEIPFQHLKCPGTKLFDNQCQNKVHFSFLLALSLIKTVDHCALGH